MSLSQYNQSKKFKLPNSSPSNISTEPSKLNYSWVYMVQEQSILDQPLRLKSINNYTSEKFKIRTDHEQSNLNTNITEAEIQQPVHQYDQSNYTYPNYTEGSTWQSNVFTSCLKTTANIRLKQRTLAYQKQRERCLKKAYNYPMQYTRSPSYSFANSKKREDLFCSRKEAEMELRFNNFKLDFTPTHQVIPLTKQTMRKSWMKKPYTPDKYYEHVSETDQALKYNQANSKCYVDMSKQLVVQPSQAQQPFTYDINKSIQTQLRLKQFVQSNSNFGKLIGRKTLSSCQQRQLTENERSYLQHK